jgi:hypothetical protein
LCDYQYDGHNWSIEIPATSFEDAHNRLEALSKGKIAGELKLSIPVSIKTTWLNSLIKWLEKSKK